jgi:fatty acid desaturase
LVSAYFLFGFNVLWVFVFLTFVCCFVGVFFEKERERERAREREGDAWLFRDSLVGREVKRSWEELEEEKV